MIWGILKGAIALLTSPPLAFAIVSTTALTVLVNTGDGISSSTSESVSTGFESGYLSADATFQILKASQPMKASVSKKTVSAKQSKLKKKGATIKRVLKVLGAQGKVTYSNASKAKVKKLVKIDSKTGKVTIKKGAKKRTYTVKVKVSTNGNAMYGAGSKTLAFKVKVK